MYPRIKRLLDVLLSVLGMVVLSPILLLTALLVKLTSPGPVLFCQKRVGLNRTNFTIYKFRTMCVDTPKNVPTHLLRNPKRFITPIGRFLRVSSLDELPQLFNILRGDMSVIGPRPALYNQADLIAARDQVNANSVRPGLTGWAQINGRDELSIPEKARLDGEYVQNISFLFDMKCFFATFACVLKQDGVREGAAKKEKNRHAS